MNSKNEFLFERVLRGAKEESEFAKMDDMNMRARPTVKVLALILAIVVAVCILTAVGGICTRGGEDRASYFNKIRTVESSMGIVVTDADRLPNQPPKDQKQDLPTVPPMKDTKYERVIVVTTADENEDI